MSGNGIVNLFARAAACYQQAGIDADAGRCFERAGEFAAAGRLHERAGRLPDAARCYEQGRAWVEAAACHRRMRAFVDAARCFSSAEDNLTAAWVLADEAQLFNRARLLVATSTSHPPTTLSEQSHGLRPPQRTIVPPSTARQGDRRPEPQADVDAARELILARCDLGGQDPDAAARRIAVVIGRVVELSPSARRLQIIDWTVLMASRLGRQDLAAMFHAACCNAGLPEASRRWEDWARSELKDATGVPAGDVLLDLRRNLANPPNLSAENEVNAAKDVENQEPLNS